MTTVGAIRRQLSETRHLRAPLLATRTELQRQLEAALTRTATSGPFEFDPSLVRRLRTDLAYVDDRLRAHDARIVGLEAQLPSEGDRAAADTRLAIEAPNVTDACTAFDAAVSTFLSTLDAAEDAARALDAIRTSLRTQLQELAALVDVAGLEPSRVPPMPILDRGLVNRAYLQGQLVAGALLGDLDDIVERDLAAAKAEVRASAA